MCSNCDNDFDTNLYPRGHYNNPVKIDVEAAAWGYPTEFQDRPAVYVIPPSGEMTKVYRSYSDYCDD